VVLLKATELVADVKARSAGAALVRLIRRRPVRFGLPGEG